MSNQPLLSLAMIVKDEEFTLPLTLNYVKTLVDEIIIVDTGSKDNTIQRAKEYGAKVFEFPWQDDFSLARNFSLEQCRGKWILVLDADEILDQENQEKLKKLLKREELVGFKLKQVSQLDHSLNPEMRILSIVRLFPNHPALRYVGCVHESLVCLDPSLPYYTEETDICIWHTGFVNILHPKNKKRKRNLKIHLKYLERHPEDLINRFNAALEYFSLDYPEDAWENIEIGLKYLSKEVSLAPSFYSLGSAIKIKLKDYSKALELADKALEINPLFPEAHFNRGKALAGLKEYQKALENFYKAIELKEYHIFYSDHSTSTWKALCEIGLTHFYLNNLKEAEEAFIKAINIKPDNTLLWINLAHTYRALRLVEKEEEAFRKAYSLEPWRVDIAYDLYNLLKRKLPVAEAIKPLVEVSKYNPHNLPLLKDIANLYYQDKKWLEAFLVYFIIQKGE